jgi:hypothetical protein
MVWAYLLLFQLFFWPPNFLGSITSHLLTLARNQHNSHSHSSAREWIEKTPSQTSEQTKKRKKNPSNNVLASKLKERVASFLVTNSTTEHNHRTKPIILLIWNQFQFSNKTVNFGTQQSFEFFSKSSFLNPTFL